MIPRSPIHFFSAGDPKEAGDANDLLHDWVIVPDFRLPTSVIAFAQSRSLPGQSDVGSHPEQWVRPSTTTS